MKIKTAPEDIWREYEKGREYNSGIDLYDTVEKNERFYTGDQWHGLNAPDLPKVTFNILHRVVSYMISQIVTDDVGISMEPHDNDPKMKHVSEIMQHEVRKIIEDQKLTIKYRKHLRDAAVYGDTAAYFYFDPDSGKIECEILDNTKVMFGNPYISEKERQPYIIIARPMLTEEVSEMTNEPVQPDHDTGDDEYKGSAYSGTKRTTMLYKFWKQNGTVWYTVTIRNAVIKPPTDLEYSLYPIAWMNWEEVKNSYHGRNAITEAIPNQISVNQMLSMAVLQEKQMAFPKVVYDASKIRRWSNRVGEAIAVQGDPNQAIASAFRAPDMSAQLTPLVEFIISETKETMGASDSALGNVNPENTSAIIAVQQASAAPLNLNRMLFYQFVEDGARIIIDIILHDYGQRYIWDYVDQYDEMGNSTPVPAEILFDFSRVDMDLFDLNVNIGGASYWNEMTQITTIDNLFNKGILTDPVVYLESIPDTYVHNKAEIIESVERQQAAAYQQQMMLAQMQQAQQTQPEGMPAAEPAAPMSGAVPVI